MGLTEAGIRRLERQELADWKKAIYDNPSYIYRTHSSKQERPGNDNKGKGKDKAAKAKIAKKKKKAGKKGQSNTLDQYNLKKQPVPAQNEEQQQVAEEPKKRVCRIFAVNREPDLENKFASN